MDLPKQAIDSIVKLSAKERLDYSIKTISGTETLYLLYVCKMMKEKNT